MLISKK